PCDTRRPPPRPLLLRRRQRLVPLRRRQQTPALRQLRAPPSVGQQAVMADAHEAARQDVLQETPGELLDRQRHLLLAPRAPVVLVTERHGLFAEAHQPALADVAAIGVTRQAFP